MLNIVECIDRAVKETNPGGLHLVDQTMEYQKKKEIVNKQQIVAFVDLLSPFLVR